jgi:hypothetical protein
MNPLTLIIAILDASPSLVDAVERIVAAFKQGGTPAAKAMLVSPEVQSTMAAAMKELNTPIAP